jgi:hypothetical protein
MGIGDFVSKVLTEYKADTSDHKRKIRDLRGEQKKLAKQQLDDLEKENSKLDKQIATLGRVGVAVGAVGAAWYAAQRSIEAYQKHSQLVTASAGSNLDRLRKASQGLATDLELLSFSAAAMNGGFKITNEEMEVATRAMLSLRKQGNDFNEVQKEVTKALVEGNSEGLKKFGLIVKTESDTLKGFQDIMAALRVEAGKFGGDFSIAGDESKRASVSLANGLRDLKVAFGQVANEGLAPIVQLLGDALGAINAIIQASSMIPALPGQSRGGIGGYLSASVSAVKYWNPAYLSYRGAKAGLNAAGVTGNQGAGGSFAAGVAGAPNVDAAGVLVSIGQALMQAGSGLASYGQQAGRAFARPGRGGESMFGGFTTEGDRLATNAGAGAGFGRMFGGSLAASQERFGIGGTRKADDPLALNLSSDGPVVPFEVLKQQVLSARESLLAEIDQMRTAQVHSWLESAFGPIDQFDAYAAAFDMLKGASLSALDAWITGSESVGAAIKKSVAESLRSLSMLLAQESLKHAAYALGSIAFLDGAGAGRHGAAAAAFGAGAIAAGAAAKALGAGQTPGGRAPANAPRVGGGFSGSTYERGGQRENVFIVGDDFGTRYERAARYRALLDTADRRRRTNRTVRM